MAANINCLRLSFIIISFNKPSQLLHLPVVIQETNDIH